MKTVYLLAVSIVLFMSSTFATEIFYVSTTGNDSNDGRSWESAYKSVQKAINAAGKVATSDNPAEVWIKAGTYLVEDTTDSFYMQDCVKLHGGFAGTETNLTERKSGNYTIFSGQDRFQIFRNEKALSSSTLIEGIVFEEGYSNFRLNVIMGGAIYNGTNASPTIMNCTFKNNSSATGGGAVYCDTSSETKFINCTFYKNSAKTYGGAIYANGANITLINCTFDENLAGENAVCFFLNKSNLKAVNSIFWTETGKGIGDFDTTSKYTFEACLLNYMGDPKLGVLADYGGIVPTIPVLKDSPAIGAGVQTSDVPVCDARGVERPTPCTIGAFEYTAESTHCAIDAPEIVLKGDSIKLRSALDGNADKYILYKDGVEIATQDTGNFVLNSTNVGESNSYYVVAISDEVEFRSETVNVLTVEKAIFYVSKSGNDSNDGKSWSNAFASIQMAIDAAHAVAGIGYSSEVWIAGGEYVLSESLSFADNVEIYGGFAGWEVDKSERINFKNETILDGNQMISIFRTVNRLNTEHPTDSAKLDNVTLRNGFTNDLSTGGGAITVQGISPAITNCRFIDNKSVSGGGAFFSGYSNTVFENCTFTGNSISNGSGCVFFFANESNVTLKNCLISNNYGRSASVSYAVEADMVFENCTLVNNVSENNTMIIASTGNRIVKFINSTIINSGLLLAKGGDQAQSSLILLNSIYWGNGYSVAEQQKNVLSGQSILVSNSIVEGGAEGENNLDQDPLLGELGYYGGLVDTIPIREGSPAIGHGSSGIDVPDNDARGFYKSNRTVGAFEYINDGIPHYVALTSSNELVRQGSSFELKIETDAEISVSLYRDGEFYKSYYGNSISESFTEYEKGTHTYYVQADNYDLISKEFTINVLGVFPAYCVRTSGSDENDGESWDTAFASLQKAVDSASKIATDSEPMEVWVEQGTYSVNRLAMRNNVQIYGGFSGSETSKDERNLPCSTTVLSGDNKNCVIYNGYSSFNSLNNSAVLDNFTIQNGYNDVTFSSFTASAIFNQNASPIFRNCMVISNNSAVSIVQILDYSCPIFDKCIFADNSGSRMLEFTTDSDIKMENCSITSNNSVDTFAYIVSSSADFINTTIFNNTSGSFFFDINSGSESVRFINSTVVNNTSDFKEFPLQLTIVNSIFWGNKDLTSLSLLESEKHILANSIIEGGANGENIINSDPMFGNFSYSDYVLPVQKGSPAIGAGMTGADIPTTDARGVARNGFVTLGAYEYGCSPSYNSFLVQNSLSGTAASYTASPFDDGITNIEKYVFGLDASKATSYADNPMFNQVTDGNTVIFSYPVNKNATDVSVKALISKDLKTWTEAAATVSGESGNFDICQISEAKPEDGKLFLKLEISQ